MIEALYQIGKVQEKKSFLEEFIVDIGEGYKNFIRSLLNYFLELKWRILYVK